MKHVDDLVEFMDVEATRYGRGLLLTESLTINGKGIREQFDTCEGWPNMIFYLVGKDADNEFDMKAVWVTEDGTICDRPSSIGLMEAVTETE